MDFSQIIIGKGEYGIPASAIEYKEGLPVYLRITDISDDGFYVPNPKVSFDFGGFGDYKKYKLMPGDIVFARTGNSTGRNYLYNTQNGELYFAGFLIKYKLNPQKVNPEFVGIYCKSFIYRNWVENVSKNGSTRKKMNAQDYLKMPFPELSLEEQSHIVEIIQPIEKKLLVNREMMIDMEEYTKTLFYKWFIDLNFPNMNGHPYKNSGGEMVEVDGKIIPKGWRLTNCGKLSTNFDSKRVPLSDNERMGRKGVFPYYGATSVMDFVDSFIFDGNYCLIAEDGSVIDKNNNPFMQYVTGRFWANNHAHVLQGKGVSTEFLYLSLSRLNVVRAVTVAIQKKINQTNLNKLPMLLPDNKTMNEFDSIIQPLFKKIELLKQENSFLSETRDLLIMKFFK
jgi:type I restriction enzyme S subunit